MKVGKRNFKCSLFNLRDSSKVSKSESLKPKLVKIFWVALCASLIHFSSGCVRETSSNLKVDKERHFTVSLSAATEYLRAGDMDGAHRHLVSAQEIRSKSAKLHNLFALLYAREGDVKKTEASYKKSLRYDDEFAPALNNYGAFLMSQGRYAEANVFLFKAAEDISYDRRGQAYENLGVCELRLKNEPAAIDAFQNALRLDPNMPRVLLELAEIYLQQGQTKLAGRYVQQFSELSKHNARSLWTSIQIARLINDKDALASHELALKKRFPDSPEYTAYKESLAP